MKRQTGKIFSTNMAEKAYFYYVKSKVLKKPVKKFNSPKGNKKGHKVITYKRNGISCRH